MRASTAADPSQLRRSRRTPLATLIALFALAAATQALAPASASAMVNQVGTAGGCTVTINVEGKIEARTSGGQLCPLTDQLLFAAAANGRLGDVYYPTGIVPREVPCPVAELCLPDGFGGKDGSGEPQHVGVLGTIARWLRRTKPSKPPKQTKALQVAKAKAKPKLTKLPLTQKCRGLLNELIEWRKKVAMVIKSLGPNQPGDPYRSIHSGAGDVINYAEKQQGRAITNFKTNCPEYLVWLDELLET